MLFPCLFIFLHSASAKLKSILYRYLFNHPWVHFMMPALTLFLSAATHSFLLLSVCRLSNVVSFVCLCSSLHSAALERQWPVGKDSVAHLCSLRS